METFTIDVDLLLIHIDIPEEFKRSGHAPPDNFPKELHLSLDAFSTYMKVYAKCPPPLFHWRMAVFQ